MQTRAGAVICSLLLLSTAGLLAGCAEWSESSSSSLTVMPSASISLGPDAGDDRSLIIDGGQIDPAIALGSDGDVALTADIPAGISLHRLHDHAVNHHVSILCSLDRLRKAGVAGGVPAVGENDEHSPAVAPLQLL